LVKGKLSIGSVVEGFRIDKLTHAGGMAHIWSVTREADGATFLMKTPVVFEGEDPAAIVGFEMEQMIMPRLKGPHVPRHIANGDFAVQQFGGHRAAGDHSEATRIGDGCDQVPLGNPAHRAAEDGPFGAEEFGTASHQLLQADLAGIAMDGARFRNHSLSAHATASRSASNP
jgi:hypothetical protein